MDPESVTRSIATVVRMDRLRRVLGPRDPIAVPPRSTLPVLVEPPKNSVRPIVIFIAAVAVLLIVVNFVNRPHEIATIPISSPSASNSMSSLVGLDVVVNVVGDVKRPGLVTLPAGSRVADAIEGAGGVTKQESIGMLNLAARVVDGQQIVVLPEVNSISQSSVTGASGGKVNLNSASESQLDELPGVGPVMAGRIIAWRTEHSRFSTVEELQEVPGIGPKVFANLADLVTI